MYQMSDTEVQRKDKPSARQLRRRAALLLSAASLAMSLLSGAAYALNIECPPAVGGQSCIGTVCADPTSCGARTGSTASSASAATT